MNGDNALASPGAEVDPKDSQEIEGVVTPPAAEQDNVEVVTNEDLPAEELEAEAGAEEEPAVEPGEEEGQTDNTPEVTPEIQAKLDKLEKRLGYEQRQRQKIERQLQARQAQAAPEGEDTAAPKAEDFATYDEYQDALVDYKVNKRINAYEQKVSEDYSTTDLEGFVEDTKELGRERYSDFDKVALSNNVPITQPMLKIMQDCENPEGIAYYMGKNIKEATAISRMSPVQAARAIGIIEAKVSAEIIKNPSGKPTKRTVSNAPPPVKPTGSGNVIVKDPEKMSQAEYEQWRAGGGGT